MKLLLNVHLNSLKISFSLNSFLQCHEVFQKRLELSRKFLICQNVCLSFCDLAFMLEIHLYVDRKLVWNSIWIFFWLQRNSTQRKNRILVLEKSQKDNKTANTFIFQ